MGNLDAPQILLGTAAITWAVMGLALRKPGSPHQWLSITMRLGAVLATIDLLTNTQLGTPVGAMIVAVATASALAKKQVVLEPQAAMTASNVITTADALDAEANHLSSTDIMRGLRTPLTSVLAAAQLAEGCSDQESSAATLVQLRSYGRQLAGAMSDIDDLGNLLRGELEVTETAFDLHEILSHCIHDITPVALEREVTLRYDASPSLPQWVQGDATRISQLFARVLQLATVRCTIGPVNISAASNDGKIHLALLNQHAGLEDPDGLGLMFARELAQALGGALHLRARDDGGSEFHIELPVQLAADWEIELLEVDAQKSAKPTSLADYQVRGNVLLITENHDHQHLLVRVLSQSGAVVTAAENRDMAVHVLDTTSYDLVLIDIQSDRETGLDTAAELRSRGLTTPILAVTSDCSTKTL
ncbi:MAG: signal transduction histidine kinase, partial [Planctomycetota bacterium]